jgi:hypothetical protein
MRTLIAAALIALAMPAGAAKLKMPNGAVRHTWFVLDGRTATCAASDQTPEAFQSDAEGPQGHLEGVTAETIAPGDVTKDDAGNIRVRIRGTDNGQVVSWAFYTSRPASGGVHQTRAQGAKPFGRRPTIALAQVGDEINRVLAACARQAEAIPFALVRPRKRHAKLGDTTRVR